MIYMNKVYGCLSLSVSLIILLLFMMIPVQQLMSAELHLGMLSLFLILTLPTLFVFRNAYLILCGIKPVSLPESSFRKGIFFTGFTLLSLSSLMILGAIIIAVWSLINGENNIPIGLGFGFAIWPFFIGVLLIELGKAKKKEL